MLAVWSVELAVDGPVAIDIMRAVRLEQHGYRVWTQAILLISHRKTACCLVRLN